MTVTDEVGKARSTCVDYGRTFQYDPLGRLIVASGPETFTGYNYDFNGNLTARYDPRGYFTCFGALSAGTCRTSLTYDPSVGYDGLNRPRAKVYTDGATATVNYTYDQDLSGGQLNYARGHLVQVAVSGGTTVQYNQFDAVGRVLRHTQSVPSYPGGAFNFSYTYNSAGQLVSETYPSGRVVTTTFDNAGRPSQLTRTLAGVARPYAANSIQPINYWAHGAIHDLQLGNHLYESWSFTPRLQTSQISLGNFVGSTSVRGLTLDYGTSNNNGNLQGQTITGAGLSSSLRQSYGYDSANRVTSVAENSWSCGFNYDIFGHRYSTNALDRCTFPTTPVSSSGYNWWTNQLNVDGATYDAAGNETGVGSGAMTFTYDPESRLTGATTSSGVTAYHYDGNGQRVMKVACPAGTISCSAATPQSKATYYVYDAMGRLASSYMMGYTQLAPNTYYVLPDQLGSRRVLTDANGITAECHDYQPFGVELLAGTDGRSGCYPSAHGAGVLFTGKERDAEMQGSAMPSGLDYFGARYYGGAMGRFTSPDAPLADQNPTDPQSWNLYSYVRNNPLVNIDPSGEDCVYTSNQTDKSITVAVEQGSCSQKGGTFINGTVDMKALTYTGKSLDVGYTDPNGAAGVFSKNLGAPVVEFPGIEGEANRAGALQIVGQAGPVVNALGETLKFGAGLAFPLTNLAVDLAVGSDHSQSAAQAAVSRKPGSLGRFKSADALRRENKFARDIIKQLNLTGKRAEQVQPTDPGVQHRCRVCC